MNTAPYPWQAKQWVNLQRQIAQGRFPHALLLTGHMGMGQFDFANAVAKLLLCDTQNGCNHCPACLLFSANTHPDLQIVTPEEDSEIIKIDQIRSLIYFMNQTSVHGGYKILIIHPADQMNLAASNALLKVLEEPPLNYNLILLIAEQASRLLPTIRSRCQTLSFLPSDAQSATNWLAEQCPNEEIEPILLALAEFAPLQVLNYLKDNKIKQVEMLVQHFNGLIMKKIDPVSVAAAYKDDELIELLHVIYFILTCLIRYKFHVQDHLLYEKLRFLTDHVKIENLFDLQDFIIQTQSDISRKINLNSQLVLEKIFCCL